MSKWTPLLLLSLALTELGVLGSLSHFKKHKRDAEPIDNVTLTRKILTTPPVTLDRLLVGGSATNPTDRARKALRLPILSLFEKRTDAVLKDIQIGLRYVWETNNEYTVALHGTGMTGMSSILDNLIEPGDKILICNTGYWGNTSANVATRLGAEVIWKQKTLGESFTLSEIETFLKHHKPQLLYVVHGDSSAGVYQNIDGIGDLCRVHNCLFLLDTVASIGMMPIKVDERKVDAVYANAQKALNGVVGLAVVSFSPRAMEKINARKTRTKILPIDIREEAKVWNIDKCEFREFSYLHSLSLPLLYALREGMASIAEEGLDAYWERHKLASEALFSELEALGLENFVPKVEDRLIGTILFKPPPGKNPYKIMDYLLEKYNVSISPGFGSTIGKVIRFGWFGKNARVENVKPLVLKVKEAIDSPETNI